MQKGIPHKTEFVLSWLTFVFIGIGIITLIKRYKEMSFPELKFRKLDFLKNKFEVVYFVIALVCSWLLVVMVAVPYISIGYNLDRMYAVAITVLSVFFVIGGIMIADFSLKKKSLLKKQKVGRKENAQVRAYLIILLVLIPYFLCVTGVMYNIFGYPYAIILNSEGIEYDKMYIQDQDSYAGKWFGKNQDEDQRIYVGDGGGSRIMRSQAIRGGSIIIDSLSEHAKINGYIYLRYYNVVDGLVLGSLGSNTTEMREYSDMFIGKNRIYDNGGSEVWR